MSTRRKPRPLEVLERLRQLEEQQRRLALHAALGAEGAAESAVRESEAQQRDLGQRRSGLATPGTALDLTRYGSLLDLDLDTGRELAAREDALSERRNDREATAAALGDAWRDRRAVERGVQRIRSADAHADRSRETQESLDLWLTNGGSEQ